MQRILSPSTTARWTLEIRVHFQGSHMRLFVLSEGSAVLPVAVFTDSLGCFANRSGT